MPEALRAIVVTAVAAAAVLWPLTHGRDGYPLSTYPMFARPRPTKERVNRAMGLRAGERVQLPPEAVGGAEPMQVVSTLRRAIGAGRADALCADVARRVAADPGLAAVEEVEIATELHDALTFFDGATEPEPLERRVRARCGVPR